MLTAAADRGGTDNGGSGVENTEPVYLNESTASNHLHDVDYTAWTSSSSLPSSQGSYYLTSDVSISSTWNVPSGTTNLCLNGHSITYTGSKGSVITLNSGANLNLYECDKTVHYYYINSDYLGVVVGSESEAIAGNPSRHGSFKGGYITGGRGAWTDNDYRGGGIFVTGGTLSLYGGTLIGCKPNANAGGIYGRIGNINIHAGSYIIGNTAVGEGGAVLTQTSCNIVMDGGVVADNTVVNGNGGGLCIQNGNGLVNGGLITGNYSVNGDAGGVYAGTSPEKLVVTGDVIIVGNSADNYGGGIAICNQGWRAGSLSISGKPYLKDNKAKRGGSSFVDDNISVFSNGNSYYSQETEFLLADKLEKGNPIGLSFDLGKGTVLYGWSSVMGEADPSDYFVSDNPAYVVSLSEGNVVLIDKPLFEGKGTEERPYLIQTSEDWDALASSINSGEAVYNDKYYKLTNDITVKTPIGCRPSSGEAYDRPFSGTFDGDYHVLNLDIDGKDPFSAPFALVHNFTVKNLTVTGTVKATQFHASGLIGASKGTPISVPSTLTIQNVKVSADVIGNGYVAGIVGHCHKNTIVMENVVFDGSIDGASMQGGFIGWGGTNTEKYSLTLKNCAFLGRYRSGANFHPVAYASGQGNVVLLTDFYTTYTGSGGSPAAISGSGQIKLVSAAVEKNGSTVYFQNFNDAVSPENWTEGTTLKLFKDVQINSTITVTTAKTLDLNGWGIISNGSRAFRIDENSCLTLTDSKPYVSRSVYLSNWIGTSAGFSSGTTSLSNGTGYVYLNGGFVTGSNAEWGSAVQNEGTFIMSGGTFVGNNAEYGNVIRTHRNRTFVMTGGQIIYNRGDRGAVGKEDAGYVKISGSPVIKYNVDFSGNQRNYNVQDDDPASTPVNMIEITGKLEASADIGISFYGSLAPFTTGWAEYMGDAKPAEYFSSDSSLYGVKNTGDELELVEPGMILFSGKGTAEDPFLITSAEDWNILASSVNGTNEIFNSSYEGKYFLLTDDITVTTAIGTGFTVTGMTNPFSGTFDGGGHTITENISIGNYSALFAVALNATVKNVNIKGYVKGGNNSSSVFGIVSGTIVLENVNASSNISGAAYLGGFIGHGLNTTITMTSCSFSGSISSTTYGGGFVGWSGPYEVYQGGCSLTLIDCVFAGEFKGSGSFHPIGFNDTAHAVVPGKVTASSTVVYSTIAANNTSSNQIQNAGYVLMEASVSQSGGSKEYYTTFNQALSAWNSAGDGAELTLWTDVTVSSAITANGNKAIDLNGFGIKKTGSGSGVNASVIYVPVGKTLTVNDSKSRNIDKYYYIDNSGLAVLTSTEAEAKTANSDKYGMFSGGYITGAYNNDGGGNSGGGITVYGNLTMNGGTVIGNYIAGAGAGILIASKGNAVLNDVSVIGNHTGNCSGGIDVNGDNANLNMTNVLIKHNHANQNIGGFGARKGSVYMKDCDVIENTAGAGTYVAGMAVQNCDVIMDGGRIIGNNTTRLSDDSVFSPGLSLRNNNYTRLTFVIKGNVTISDNRYGDVVDDSIGINTGKTIKIGGELVSGNGKPFAVKLQGSGNRVFSSSDDISFNNPDLFASYSSDYYVGKNPAGQLVITKPASVSFDVDGHGTAPKNIEVIPGRLIDEMPVVSDVGIFKFAGWYKEKECVNAFDVSSDVIYADTTVYSKWILVSDGIDFTPWFDGSKLPSEEGSYYLKTNVSCSGSWTVPAGTVNLELYGYGITFTNTVSSSGVIIGSGSVLNVFDHGTNTNYYIIGSDHRGTIVGEAAYNNSNETKGSFTGGYITSDGRGFKVSESGVLNIYGGTVIGCFGTSGSAINSAGTVNISGGSVIGNVSGSEGGLSGTIYNAGILTVSGGLIKNNYSYNGGGIFHEIQSGSSLTISGGQITGNRAENEGAGIYLNDRESASAAITVSGNTFISGNANENGDSNLYIPGEYVVNIGGKLSESALIGITLANPERKFTAGLDGKGSVSNFNADISTYEIRLIAKEALLGIPHVHSWVYSADGNVITATCMGVEAGVCEIESQTVTITANGKTYDGQPVTATLSKSTGWTSANGLPETISISYSGNTEAGTYTASITIGDFTASDSFTIGKAQMTVTSTGYTGNYDGSSYGISVNAPDNSTVTFGLKEGEYNLDKCPVFADAGTYTVYYQVTHNNYITVTGSATVKINPIDVTVVIVGSTGSFDYIGSSYEITGFTAACENSLYDVTSDFTFSGVDKASRTDAGTTNMNLTASMFTNTNPNFATVTFVITDGYVTVKPIDVTVVITGNTGSFDYDGTAHEVTGYTASCENSLYNVNADFTFSGNASASRTDNGTTFMGLAASQFTNTNANFATVTFIVTDGSVEIKKINATVEIVGSSEVLDYDGNAHEVNGFTATASTSLYDVENDFTFSGTDHAERTDAGKAFMGLLDNQFENTNSNFETVTFIVTDGFIEINQITATVTITGNNGTFDYSGEAHAVTGYEAAVDTDLYDLGSDYIFSGTDYVELTDAGTAAMGLTADMFANTNPNFITVTFVIVDGYVEIKPIAAKVTITGNTGTFDYTGEPLSVTGYTAEADTSLYNVEKDFVFSGAGKVDLTDAGSLDMGLKAEDFENVNPNFITVTFVITDGSITVEPVDAVIVESPVSTEPKYSGSAISLVTAGSVEGGVIHFAVGYDLGVEPSPESYSAAVPTAAELGNYYVWYKVVSDANHNDLDPVCVKVVLSDADWFKISGILYDSDGTTPIANAVVTLVKGTDSVDYVITGEDGSYEFIVKKDAYNIVAEFDGVKDTAFVKLFDNTVCDIVTAEGITESVINVSSGDEGSSLGIAVGGLDKEAKDIRTSDGISKASTVSVIMNVESKNSSDALNSASIIAAAKNKHLTFFEITITKTIDSESSALESTSNVLEIAIPYEKIERHGIVVYRYHGSAVQIFEENDSKKDGTFFIDKENKIIYIYANQFSTFAVGYTPFYNVNTTMSLGSYKGPVTVTLKSLDDTANVFTMSNVSMEKVSFADVPMGRYEMTVTWTDGAENTLTANITVARSAEETAEGQGDVLRADSFKTSELFIKPYLSDAGIPEPVHPDDDDADSEKKKKH